MSRPLTGNNLLGWDVQKLVNANTHKTEIKILANPGLA